MKTGLLLLLTGLISSAAPMLAADEPQPVTVNVNSTTGAYAANGNSSWRKVWTTNATVTPGVSLQTNAANFNGTYSDAENNLAYYVGTNNASKFFKILSTDANYFVSAYNFEYKLVDGGNVRLQADGMASSVTVTSSYQSVSATVEEGTEATVRVTGDNKGVILHNFTVTLSPVTAEPEPAPEYPMLKSNIVNGAFDEWTTWFNLRIHSDANCLYNAGEEKMTLTSADQEFHPEEKYQWAFVQQEDGTYKIYNRETGTAKVLAAPKNPANGGEDYPRLMAEGNDAYAYTWDVITAETYSNGTPLVAAFNGKYPFYLRLHGTENAYLNRFNGNLNFWTGGYDGGSVFTPEVVETKIAVSPQSGYLTRDGQVQNTQNWVGLWHLDKNFALTFGGAKNNVSTTGADRTLGDFKLAPGDAGAFSFAFGFPHSDYYVSDIELNARLAGAGSPTAFTVAGTNVTLTQTDRKIALSDLKADGAASIYLQAPNNEANMVIVSGMVVTVKRMVREFIDGTLVFDNGDSKWMRRIPALAVTKSGRLIAAYDYRYGTSGFTDLSANNIDIHIAVSDDNGATWSAPDYARNAAGDSVTAYDRRWAKDASVRIGNDDLSWSDMQTPEYAVDAWNAAWGDAAIVGDRESDKVLMVAVGGTVGFFGSRHREDNMKPQSVIRWVSDDAGRTWSEAQNITEEVYGAFDGTPGYVVDGLFFGSGRMAQSRHIKIGDYYRIYAVASTQTNGGSTRNYALYSDDFGLTWHILGGVETCPVPSAGDEPKCEELPDGSVLLAARRNGSNRNFNLFRYTNPTTGEGHWDNQYSTNLGFGQTINACDGEIYILPVQNNETSEKCFMALQSFPFSAVRQYVSIAWKVLSEAADFDSPSDFGSWNGRYQVSRGNSAYSTMILTRGEGNPIGFFYEEDILGHGAYDGVYKNIPLETITDGLYSYVPDSDGAIALALTAKMAEARSNDFLADAVDAYLAEPTYANYIELNRAEYGDPEADPDSYDFDYATPVWPGATAALRSIALTPAEVTLNVGETAVVNVTRLPEYTTDTTPATFSSSDEAVATVAADGTVTAVGAGSAVITATVGSLTAECAVTVTDTENGIDEINAADGAGRVYDLQGRRVVSPVRGLYIVNGRKAVIR